jgi:ribonuclease P protein component
MREEDVSAEQPEAEEDPRVPRPDAYSRRPRRDRSPAQQGPRQPVCLIWRLRDRAAFRAVARGRRRRHGAVEVIGNLVGSPAEPPRVAYAVGRNVGNAVVRNRVRRRLRSAVAEHAQTLRPGWGYLVRASASAADATYSELNDAVRLTLHAHREHSL